MGIDYAADAGEMMSDSGQTCIIGNASSAIQCVAGAESRAILVDDLNDVVVYERECLIKTADVSSVPAQQSAVTINSVVYAVADLSNDPDEGVIRLTIQRTQDQ